MCVFSTLLHTPGGPGRAYKIFERLSATYSLSVCLLESRLYGLAD